MLKVNKIIWITGLSSTGKTTLANNLVKYIDHSIVFDGDESRKRHNNYNYTVQGVIKAMNEIGQDALNSLSQGYCPIVASISPFLAIRKNIRYKSLDRYFEILLTCDLPELQRRDSVKNIYKKKNIIGISIPHEQDIQCEMVIDTTCTDEVLVAKAVIDKLKNSPI